MNIIIKNANIEPAIIRPIFKFDKFRGSAYSEPKKIVHIFLKNSANYKFKIIYLSISK